MNKSHGNIDAKVICQKRFCLLGEVAIDGLTDQWTMAWPNGSTDKQIRYIVFKIRQFLVLENPSKLSKTNVYFKINYFGQRNM